MTKKEDLRDVTFDKVFLRWIQRIYSETNHRHEDLARTLAEMAAAFALGEYESSHRRSTEKIECSTRDRRPKDCERMRRRR